VHSNSYVLTKNTVTVFFSYNSTPHSIFGQQTNLYTFPFISVFTASKLARLETIHQHAVLPQTRMTVRLNSAALYAAGRFYLLLIPKGVWDEFNE